MYQYRTVTWLLL